jgi:two-component system nitrogen regulation sensor histidine kinase GlnL
MTRIARTAPRTRPAPAGEALRRRAAELERANARLTAELAELRGSHEDLLSSLQDGVIVLDASGRVILLNQAAEELTGLADSAARGRPIGQLFPPPAPLAALAGRTLALGRSHADFELSLRRPDGSRRTVSAVASQVSAPGGECRGAVLVLRDLTSVRELEEQVRRSERLASLGVLAAGLAHEVRNPLVGVRAAAQLLAKEPAFPPALHEFTGVILREVDRLNRLVDDLLALAGTRPPQRRPCNVNQVVEEALGLQAAALQAAGVGVLRRYDPAIPALEADPDRLLQVFLNLLRNAIEAMAGSPGAVTVSTRFERVAPQCGGRSAAVVEVADQGPGMAPEVQAKLFTPFFTTKAKGTGLGLPLSLRIVEEHEGALELVSRPGAGTTARVLLPLAARRARV